MIGSKEKFSFRLLIIALLVLGIFFRFVNLDKKVYWGDEVFTSFRIAGYTLPEVTQELFDRQPKSIEELQQYQQPNSQKGIADTIASLAIEDSQHPPLYYIIARLWEQTFGSAMAVRRSLPALISLLVFPCLYYLCQELFATPVVSWLALGIVAISPFHVLYAQEVREYSLWSVTILLSSWLLLRSLRLSSPFSWLLYAASLPLLLYTYLFSVLIAIGHAIYVFGIEKWRFTKTSIAFLIATSIGFLSFAPWLLVVVNSLSTIDETTSLLQAKVSLPSLFQIWLINLSRCFADLDSQGRIIPFDNLLFNSSRVILLVSILFLVGYAKYFIYRQTDKQVWLFILTLMGVTGLALILPDLILGGIRSSATRYLVPCYLGIQLSVAYLLGKLITSEKRQDFGRWLAIAILSVGVFSCAVSSQAETWWNKYGSYYNPQVARLINQANRPLAIATSYVPRILSLSYLLDPKAKIQFVSPANLSEIPAGYSDVFLYRPDPELKSRLKKQLNYKIETVYQSPPVYQYLKPISQHGEIWISKLEKP